ncbi:MAG: glutamate--tRNA ligase [Candidatus Dojkabacteria bacterium]
MVVRTRFAPSPTGFLHIGSVRTALYAYAFAKKHGGQFIVRIEDTDQKRRVEGSIEKIFEGLEEIRLIPDESSKHGGEKGPYIQSERKEIYLDYAKKLIEEGNAYYCFLEGDELEKFKKEFKGKGFRSPYRDQDISISKKMIEEGKPFVIRLKVPNNEIIEYEDGIQGKTKFNTDLVGDEVLIKSNGMASYHLAVVVDDHLMEITHVMRAVEWFPSTPKQILIHRFLGIEMPPYYHLPTILDPEGGKLSKRKGAVALHNFFEEGYLPEALLNFMMLLGWSSPLPRVHGEKEREIYSLQEFIEIFDLRDLNKSNAVFNRDKLRWFNKQYILNSSDDEFRTKFINWVEKYEEDEDFRNRILSDLDLDKKLELVKGRSETLSQSAKMINFFYYRPLSINWDVKQLEKVKDKIELIKAKIHKLHESFDTNSKNWTHEQWEKGMREIGDSLDVKHGDVFMVLRVAVVGEPVSPPLFECLQILGKDEVVKRLG